MPGGAPPIPDGTSVRPDVSVVIVHYRTLQLLQRCLEAVAAGSGGIRIETFVVDNGSPEFDLDREQAAWPDVHFMANPNNLGFATASNQALRHARGRYILLLNPDAFVAPDTLPAMVDYMDMNPRIGCSTARLERDDGQLDRACRRSFPTPLRSFYRMTLLSELFPSSPTFARYNLTYLDEWQEQDIDSPCGAFMLVRREILRDVGLLDERFFMYGEDLDWALRIKRRGWRVTYNPVTTVRHLKRASSAHHRRATIGYFYDAMRLFYRKHYAPSRPRLMNRLMLAGIRMRQVIHITQMRFGR